jgi:hypothetical protein
MEDPNIERFPEEPIVTISLVTLRDAIQALQAAEGVKMGNGRYMNIKSCREWLEKLVPNEPVG